jgi:hypothetical protein
MCPCGSPAVVSAHVPLQLGDETDTEEAPKGKLRKTPAPTIVTKTRRRTARRGTHPIEQNVAGAPRSRDLAGSGELSADSTVRSHRRSLLTDETQGDLTHTRAVKNSSAGPYADSVAKFKILWPDDERPTLVAVERVTRREIVQAITHLMAGRGLTGAAESQGA